MGVDIVSGKAADLREAERLRSCGYEVYVDGWPDLLVVRDGLAYGVELKRSGDGWDAVRQQPLSKVFAEVMNVPYLLARNADGFLALDLEQIPRNYQPPVLGNRVASVDMDPRLRRRDRCE